jgi:hypothetical protein
MNIRFAIAFIGLFLGGQIAIGGTWDVGEPFNNNDAAYWTWDLESSTDLSVVEAALQAVIESAPNVELPTASIGVAAAEVIAALRGNPRPDLPENVVGWIKTQSQEPGDDLVALALRATVLVQDDEKSELARQWTQRENQFEIWKENLANLEQRLK